MKDSTDVSCPKCGADIPPNEAVSHRLREQLEADFEQRRTELNAVLAQREQRLEADQAAIKQRALSVQAEVNRQLDIAREQLLADAGRRAEDKLRVEMTGLQQQVTAQGSQLAKAREAELKLLDEKRKIEEAQASLELDIARRLSEERGKIAEGARQQAVEGERLKLADRENVIDGLKRQISELQQKAEQGSMQAHGETLELTLESDLRTTFLIDRIEEVKKGERGADVTQHVQTNAGLACGIILWEAKRARKWSAQWPDKLKEDQRAAGADLVVIVTTCPPASLRGIGQANGIWVCEPAFALALAGAHNTDKIKIWVGKDRAGQDMFASIEPAQVAHGLEFK